MIDVISQEAVLAQDPQTEQELYELMVDYIGNTMRIRRKLVDRTGVLERVSYNRQLRQVYFSFGRDEMLEVNIQHHVEVKLDGVWKVICMGIKTNRKLS